MMRRSRPHAERAAARSRLGERAHKRNGPRIVRLDQAGLLRHGATGERGLLHFGERSPLLREDPESRMFPRH